jgi:hypothetical protein
MVWVFERNGQRLRYEIRRRDGGDGYELVVSYPDRRSDVEHLLEPLDLLRRCAEVGAKLKADGWTSSGAGP